MSSGNSGPGAIPADAQTGAPTQGMPEVTEEDIKVAGHHGPRPFVSAANGDNPTSQDPVVQPTSPVKLPSVQELEARVRSGETVISSAGGTTSIPPGRVDTAAFTKAQAAFIEAQTKFLAVASMGSPNYSQEVTTYSHAQTDLIRAQAALLKQLGVI